ncbi:hypothetical protein KIL84_020373 [Mauremys mutica]|uniref:Uncharacterized protein n=1 Tax=Mauremys mutica TaxID=74926 RepID=A0A9D3XVJ0_9SAUR|nr:hypothetical protein KIL84_020373 [Mauremys mutica]
MIPRRLCRFSTCTPIVVSLLLRSWKTQIIEWGVSSGLTALFHEDEEMEGEGISKCFLQQFSLLHGIQHSRVMYGSRMLRRLILRKQKNFLLDSEQQKSRVSWDSPRPVRPWRICYRLSSRAGDPKLQSLCRETSPGI